VSENIERWEDWIKEMFHIDDETPKTYCYNKKIWKENEKEIEKIIETTNKNDTKEQRKSKNKRNKSELKKILAKNNELNEALNTKITKEEVYRAIRTLKNNKSFGSDRIPAEIYKENKEIMTNITHEIITEAINHGKMLNDWNDGIITLLRKKKDKLTLITTDQYVY